MATISEIRDVHDGQIRKALAGAVLLGSADAPEIETLTTGASSELAAIPQEYKSMGRHPRDGSPKFTPTQEQNEVLTWGELEASRIDAISKNLSISWTCQDTRKSVLAAATGVNLDNVKADAITGEVQIVEPTDPNINFYRAFFLTVDGVGDDAYFIARYCPKFVITTVGEESWNQDAVLVTPFTGRALVDTTHGYSVKRFYGGPGWKKNLGPTGFELAAP